jgi:hypothetical protein
MRETMDNPFHCPATAGNHSRYLVLRNDRSSTLTRQSLRVAPALTRALEVGKSNVGKSVILDVLATSCAAFRMGRRFGAECADVLFDGRQVTYKTNTSSVSNNRT